MKKVLVILVMIAGLTNVAMADSLSVIRETITSGQSFRFEEVDINNVPEVVMNAFDTAYQNIGIEKVEAAKINNVEVYKFTIITYQKKELTVYYTATGEEIKF